MVIRRLSWAPASPERYRYTALPKPHSLRLVQVEKFHPDQPRVRCWLYTCPLAEGLRPPFDALSYCWNSPVIPEEDEDGFVREDFWCEIELNGTSWMVTESLYDALLARSKSGEQRLLWVDALCINQTHEEEKTEQVALMGEIYTAADCVIIWLGEDRSNVDEMVYVHTKLATALDRLIDTRGARFAFQSSPLDPVTLEALALDLSLNEWYHIWHAYFNFFRTRRWFFRAWIVQEVVLAKDVQVHCGDKMIPWEPLLSLGRFVMYSGWAQVLAPSEQKLKLAGINELSTIWSMQIDYRSGGPWSSDFRHSQQALSGAQTDSEFWYWYLLWLLDNVRGQQASNPKDKIYCILGIVSKFSPRGVRCPIRPDYSKALSISDMFLSTASLLLDRLPTLAFLTMVEDQAERSILDLPSWVPDWSAPGSNYGHLSWAQIDSASIYNASKVEHKREKTWIIKGRELSLHCACFDTVTNVSEPIGTMTSTHWIQPALKICEKMSKIYAPTGQHRIEALWRTLIADEFEGSHPAPLETGQNFKDWAAIVLPLGLYLRWLEGQSTKEYLEELSVLDDLSNESVSLLPRREQVLEKAETIRSEIDTYPDRDDHEVLEFLKEGDGKAMPYGTRLGATGGSRRLYITAGGYLGIGPGATTAGAVVALVEGARVPFVLEKAHDPWSMKLLGETYVHGFMHGEMVDSVGKYTKKVKVV